MLKYRSFLFKPAIGSAIGNFLHQWCPQQPFDTSTATKAIEMWNMEHWFPTLLHKASTALQDLKRSQITNCLNWHFYDETQRVGQTVLADHTAVTFHCPSEHWRPQWSHAKGVQRDAWSSPPTQEYNESTGGKQNVWPLNLEPRVLQCTPLCTASYPGQLQRPVESSLSPKDWLKNLNI